MARDPGDQSMDTLVIKGNWQIPVLKDGLLENRRLTDDPIKPLSSGKFGDVPANHAGSRAKFGDAHIGPLFLLPFPTSRMVFRTSDAGMTRYMGNKRLQSLAVDHHEITRRFREDMGFAPNASDKGSCDDCFVEGETTTFSLSFARSVLLERYPSNRGHEDRSAKGKASMAFVCRQNIVPQHLNIHRPFAVIPKIPRLVCGEVVSESGCSISVYCPSPACRAERV